MVIWLRYKRRYRRLRALVLNGEVFAVVAACVVLLGPYYLYLYYYWGLPSPFKEDEVGILIAEIPGDVNRKDQNSYADAIRRMVSSTADLRDVVRVRLLERPLPNDPDKQHKKALWIGRSRRAALVIRAVLTAGGHSLWGTIVDQPEFPREESALGEVPQAKLAELDQLSLPSEITLLARCVLGFSYYRRESYEEAVQHFSQILAVGELPAAAPTRPQLNFLSGNSYWYLRRRDPATFVPEAIAAYDKTLSELSRDRYPIQWARTMNNRGTAYGE
ncbi:MAG: hypothetical protein HYY26_07230, partial [Acidobacteria bacterium]|nr:hypothetical protein [Acidobacteriota bacterium]